MSVECHKEVVRELYAVASKEISSQGDFLV